ncbi:phosphoserine phosphatase SerB [Thalassotalea sp. M1531]|uniref:Phosphoserine phosphatase n=1 Tax=Thalassotalea algicola TaxID=2716224 RepID=A0A7Y0LD17_9GAMM|nr:phosphoserine phosphatase SerB [Thalassotalea algicola]NMP31958.1 phosphoserine phosphatase SerB [Thalassotalea algicola]
MNNSPLSLPTNTSQTWAEVIKEFSPELPATLLQNAQAWIISAGDEANNSLELIIFSDTSIAQFTELTTQCGITPVTLLKQVSRNNQASIRFSIACEDIAQAREKLVTFTLANNIEAAIVENAPTLAKPGLLVMDMDSTTIEIECIDEIAKLAGVGEQVAEVTELAMQGKLDFAQSLHQRVATLEGASESILAEVANDIPLMPGLLPLIDVLKQHGWKVAIASGGFTYFADHLKNILGLDAAVANTLEIIDGKLTGKVLGDVVDANVKAQTLGKLAKEYDIEAGQMVAMGDGANDLVMMSASDLGVAYKAKPLVLAQADSSISHSGLDCMLHWLA